MIKFQWQVWKVIIIEPIHRNLHRRDMEMHFMLQKSEAINDEFLQLFQHKSLHSLPHQN